MLSLWFGTTNICFDDSRALAKGDSDGDVIRPPMSKFCGLDRKQTYAAAAPLGQELVTLSTNSNIPSDHACVMKRSQSMPAGCFMSAQLALPAFFVTVLMYCSVTVYIDGPVTTSQASNGSWSVGLMRPSAIACRTSRRNSCRSASVLSRWEYNAKHGHGHLSLIPQTLRQRTGLFS